MDHRDDAYDVASAHAETRGSHQSSALVRCRVSMASSTAAIVAANEIKKGDVLATARFAAVHSLNQAVLLLPTSRSAHRKSVRVDFVIGDSSVDIEVRVATEEQTRVVVDALCAAMMGALTVYDMCKAVDRTMSIGNVTLWEETNGSRIVWQRELLDARDGAVGSAGNVQHERGPVASDAQDPRPEEPQQILSHVDGAGKSRMVDVSDKDVTLRRASASCVVHTRAGSQSVASADSLDPLHVAQLVGIQAAKQTSHLIPLCHTLNLNEVRVDVTATGHRVEISATVSANYRTGVEMEALTACAFAALSVTSSWCDVDPATRIDDLVVLTKSGGRSGDWGRLTERAIPTTS